jgi:nickel superoxide dismutase
MKKSTALLGLMLFIPLSAAWPHCQVPCGIYDDEMRLKMIGEHIKTIERSIQQVVELSKADSPNYNQIVRWINNKEEHADELTHIVTWYFMTQRVKPASGDSQDYQMYVNQITMLHEMMFYAMKAKQSTDEENVERLTQLLNGFRKAYLGE